MSPRIASLLGYDPLRVVELPQGHQRALALVALAALPGLTLLAVSAAYGTWLASGTWAVALGVGAGAGLYLLNLLRVAVAGGGVAPQQSLATVVSWMPRTVPLVMLSFLGAFFAQPLILGLQAAEHDAAVEDLRRTLGARHREAVLRSAVAEREDATLAARAAEVGLAAAEAELARRLEEQAATGPAGGRTLEAAAHDARGALEARRRDVVEARAALERASAREQRLEAEEVRPYLAHLARSRFLVRRVHLAWTRPALAIPVSAAMLLLMVLPWLASATVARRASQAYEAVRWRSNRAIIDAAYVQARRLEREALGRWPSFSGDRLSLNEDPPYDTKPRSGFAPLEAPHG